MNTLFSRLPKLWRPTGGKKAEKAPSLKNICFGGITNCFAAIGPVGRQLWRLLLRCSPQNIHINNGSHI